MLEQRHAPREPLPRKTRNTRNAHGSDRFGVVRENDASPDHAGRESRMKAILDHVAIAVKDLAAALAFYRDALGLEIEPPEEVASQRVRAHFIPVGDAKLELLEGTAPDSAIAKFTDKRGPGLHHI